jgi:uncharacterized protein (TIGR03437 family)
MRFFSICLATALVYATAFAQTVPSQFAANVGMPAREYAPGVIVFYPDLLHSTQEQRLYVNAIENGVVKPIQLIADNTCGTSVPSPNALPFASIRWEPGVSADCTSHVSILRDGRPLGAIPIYVKAALPAASAASAIASPTAMTFTFALSPLQRLTLSPEPQTVSINATSFYATLIAATPYVQNGYVALLNMTVADGRVNLGPSGNAYPQPEQLYIETASGFEVVRITPFAQTYPILVTHPGSINLSIQGGGRIPDASFTVTDSMDTGVPLTVTSSQPWVRVSPSSGTTSPATPFTISFDPTVLPNGLSSASIIIRSSTYVNSPLELPVAVIVKSGGVATGTLSLTPASLSFTGVAAGSHSPAQSISVGAASPLNYTAVASTQSGGPWLRVVPPGTINSATNPLVQVGVDITGLSPAVYTGAITFSVPGTTFVRAAPVTLTVTGVASPAIPTVTAVPASLAFSYRTGDDLPAVLPLQVAGTAGLPFTAQAASDGDWLAVSPVSGIVSPVSALSVTVNAKATALAPGPHNGAISLSAAGAAPVSVPVRLTMSAALPSIARVLNAASFVSGPIAAGEMITIFGDHLGPAEGQTLSLDANGDIATITGGVEVLVGGYAAPVLYASDRQVSAIVPYEIVAPFVFAPTVIVLYKGQSSNGFAMEQATSAPALFTADSSGLGYAAALNSDFNPNSAARPAAPGDILQLFVTGEGQTIPAGRTGKITSVAAQGPLTPQPIQQLSVTIDGHSAKVLFYGEAPGIVAGMMQINVEVPPGARPGEVPVVVTLGSGGNAHTTQSGVSVAIR